MTRIFLRRGTSSDLSSVVLATGEAAYATDTKVLKIGDGGTNFASLSGLVGGTAGGVSAFTALSDTPGNFSGAASKFVKVNSGASALEFVTVSDSDTTYTAGSGLTLTGTTFHVTGTFGGGGGSTTFVALTDTPANFTSAGGKFVKVNSGATALEFVAGTSSGGISGVVDDTSPQLGGNLDVDGNDIVSTSNGDIDLLPNGNGKVVFRGGGTGTDANGAGRFKLNCENNSHGITIQGPPHSAGASYTLTLPSGEGSADQVLKTNGAGGLDWVAQTTDTNTTYTAGSGLELSGTTFNSTLVSDTGVAGGGSAVMNIVTIGSGAYTALSSKNANTLYFIT